MSTALLVVALVVALLSVPTVAGMTAWGLAGGDGTPKNPVFGVLAVLVGFGSVYNAAICFRAFFLDVPEWAWWLMWAPPAAGVVGLLLSAGEMRREPWWTVLAGLGMQLVLAVPALLLWAGGVVG
ncbi:MAG TPA: hypothetical protein VFZ64_14810 [Nocardioidaceae bacterium]